MAGEKIEYNGEYLYLEQIARKEGLGPTTLRNYYKRAKNDIHRAIKLCREVSRGPNTKIEYKGKMLAIYVIAKQEEIASQLLKAIYEETNDIYRAIELCKEGRGRSKSIKYKGEWIALSVIAKKEEIDYRLLKAIYNECKDIDKAVDECKRKKQQIRTRKEEIQQKKEEEKILYNGNKLSIEEISEIEGVDLTLLKRISKEIQEPQRAVFTTRCKMQSLKTARVKQYKINLYDISLILGIKYRHVINFLVSGMSFNEIKEKFTTTNLSQKMRFENKKTLLEFGKQKKLDFTFMYRAIHTYRKDLSTATQECEKDNKNIPMAWIVERYVPILEKLNVPNMQTMVIVDELQKNKVSLEEAIEKSIIRKNSRMHDISFLWAETLYGMIKAREILGQEYQSQIVLSEIEQNFINSSEKEIRDLLGKFQDSPNSEFQSVGDGELEL